MEEVAKGRSVLIEYILRVDRADDLPFLNRRGLKVGSESIDFGLIVLLIPL